MDQSDLSDAFTPLGHCLLWRPDLLWLHVISDTLIVVAYIAIPVTLVLSVRATPGLPYKWAFVLFSAFIFLGGLSHAASIVAIWKPIYYVEGYLKAITGAVSVTTAVLFVPILPRALAAVLREFSNDARSKKI